MQGVKMFIHAYYCKLVEEGNILAHKCTWRFSTHFSRVLALATWTTDFRELQLWTETDWDT